MGAKTALLAFSDGDLRPALLGATRSDLAEAETLVRRVHRDYVQRGYTVEPVGDSSLDDCHPEDDITGTTILAGADGSLVRSLSLSPDGGIQENVGEPYDFELPYWAGEHPVEPVRGLPSEEPYPLPFHPLELGEDALRALFGFVLEGRFDPDDIDPEEVHMHQFRVSDPTGRVQAERQAVLERALARMGPPQRFAPGGP